MAELSARPIAAGKYRHFADIERLKYTQDTAGGKVEDWEAFLSAHIRIEPLTGREYWEAQKNNPEVTGKIYMRFALGMPASPRFKVKGHDAILYAVGGPLNMGGANKEICYYYREEVAT